MTERRRPRHVIVGRAEDLYLDPEGGPWVTVCDKHSRVCNHPTKRLAIEHARYPEGWCPPCDGREED